MVWGVDGGGRGEKSRSNHDASCLLAFAYPERVRRTRKGRSETEEEEDVEEGEEGRDIHHA